MFFQTVVKRSYKHVSSRGQERLVQECNYVAAPVQTKNVPGPGANPGRRYKQKYNVPRYTFGFVFVLYRGTTDNQRHLTVLLAAAKQLSYEKMVIGVGK
jgi:hypothetical protein